MIPVQGVEELTVAVLGLRSGKATAAALAPRAGRGSWPGMTASIRARRGPGRWPEHP